MKFKVGDEVFVNGESGVVMNCKGDTYRINVNGTIMWYLESEIRKEMNFKVGDRVKVANIEDVGTVVTNCRQTDQVFVRWDNYKDVFLRSLWYPAYQVRLAEEEQKYKVVGCSDACCGEHQKLLRLSRKEIKKELSDLAMESSGNIQSQLMGLSLLASTAKRKFLHKLLRQLSAEAFCVDKVLAERIDQLADGV